MLEKVALLRTAATDNQVELQAVAEKSILPPSVAEYGTSMMDAPGKGEDTLAVHQLHGLTAFGVFDGHGGKQSAQHCADTLLQDLLASGMPTSEAMAEAFWHADEVLGKRGVTDGTTATVLVVQQSPSPSDGEVALECLLGWVGDSRAVCVDISAGTMSLATQFHNPKTKDEVASLGRMATVRTLVEVTLRQELEPPSPRHDRAQQTLPRSVPGPYPPQPPHQSHAIPPQTTPPSHPITTTIQPHAIPSHLTPPHPAPSHHTQL